MIVPEFWSEAKERVILDGRSLTFTRFGWSDVSEEEALRNATDRVAEAAARARTGESVRLKDHKVSYNGSEGLPIREEIVEKHGDAVITRNGYGALCLNTPDVLFADVDVSTEPRYNLLGWVLYVAVLYFAIEQKGFFGPWWPVILAGVVSPLFVWPIARAIVKVVGKFRADPFRKALLRIEDYSLRNPSWLIRVYRTPNGFRLLVMHDTFSPEQEPAFQFMQAIHGDSLYEMMCRNQKCFRARISPKPWRLGVDRLRQRGVWPISPERISDRRAWVEDYSAKSLGYASCRFEKTIGNGVPHKKCEMIRKVHDEYSRADSDLPIA